MFRKSLILVFSLFVLALAIIGCGGGGGGSASNPAGPALVSGETANLSGTVLFDNAPIPFASVHLYKSDKAHTIGMAQLPSLKGSLVSQQIIGDGAYSTTTSAEGTYNFTNIPVGQYTLIAMRDENHQFVQTGVLLGQVTTINPQLTPTGKITGKITLSIGGTAQAIAGAFVYINGTSYIAVSDTAGNFTINNVPSNALTTSTAYEILVSSTKGTASSVPGVVVNPGATTDIGTIAMTAPAQASYAILNGSLVAGKGVSNLGGLFVILTHQTSGSIFGTYTDATGKFQFRVMETGNFLVLCPEADYSYTPDPLTVSVTSLTNQPITLSPITVDADLNEATGGIIGTVSHLGSPFAGAIINVTGTSLLGVSDSSGNFIINKVPVNTSATLYTLEISSNKGTATAKSGVIVNQGQATDVGAFIISLPATGYKNIVGTLTTALAPLASEGSLPAPSPALSAVDLSNRLIHLTGPDGRVSAAYSNLAGGFSFITTQTGDHTATVIDASFDYFPRTQAIVVTTLDNATQALAEINVTSPNLDNKIRVDGFVFKVIKVKPETDESGVSLKLTPEATTEPNLYTFSRADGSFEFFVIPGTYTLTVEGLYQLDPTTPITINIASPYTFTPSISVRPAQAVNSVVTGSVTWPAVAGWSFTEGEVILEGASFVDRRIVSNASPAPFKFENVPAGSYVLKSNPLRNGYTGVTAAFTVSEGIDLTAPSLTTTFIAPLVTSVTPAGTVSGSNFGTVLANIGATVDDRPVTVSSLTGTSCVIDLNSLTPGEHVLQMHKIITSPAGRVDGNKMPFTRPVQQPTGIIASSTDTSITFTWQNAPYISEVDIRLLIASDSTVVRPLQRIIGNSFTYNNLQASTTYRIEITSTYPGMPPSATTPFSFATTAEGINNIGSFTLPIAGSPDQIFAFEVDNNVAFVGFYNSSLGNITIQPFNLLTKTALAPRTVAGMAGANSSVLGMAANSDGVFLTYTAVTEDNVIACFNRGLNSVIASLSLTLPAPDGLALTVNSAKVRSLNNRIFLVAKNNASVYARELSSLLTVSAQYNASSAGGTFADIALDNVTQKIYLSHSESVDAVVKAFNNMNINTAPAIVGNFSGAMFYSLYASNNQVYLVKDSSGLTADVMDARSGYIRNINVNYDPGCFGFDKQNRIWMSNLLAPNQLFMQLNEALNVEKTLRIPNLGNMATTLSRIKLDRVTGMMYMLHFDVNNALAVYRYNSNY